MPTEAYRRTERARGLRNNATDAERKLWRALSCYRPPFTRQLPIGPYFADLAHRRARVVVELDGSQHVDNEHDQRRTRELESLGWRVLRFWNNEALGNVEGVATMIVLAVNERLPEGEQCEAAVSRTGRMRTPRTREKKNHP